MMVQWKENGAWYVNDLENCCLCVVTDCGCLYMLWNVVCMFDPLKGMDWNYDEIWCLDKMRRNE